MTGKNGDSDGVPPARTRAATLEGFAEIVRDFGLDPYARLKESRLDPSCLDDPDRMIPVARVNDLLESTALAAGTDDFGLRLAGNRRLANLGLIALAAREEPTVRDALLCLQRTMQLHNEGLAMDLLERGDSAVVRTRILARIGGSTRQATEMSTAIVFRILRELLGAAWLPNSVQFVHGPSGDLSRHRAFFGISPRFHSDHNGVSLRRIDLERPMPRADSQSRRTLQNLLAGTANEPRTRKERISALILDLLPSGRCSAHRVAGFLGVDRRTLARWLAEEGTSFTRLVDEIRLEAARRHLSDRGQTVAALAPVLGFSDGSAFARWLRARTGESPRLWRKASATGNG